MDITGICRLATTHLGIQAIDDINDLNPTANAFRDVWDACRDDLFSEHRFGFADTQIALQLIDDTGDLIKGWQYVYGYPVNVARVWAVYNELSAPAKESKEFEKKFLVSENRNVLCSNEAEALCDATYIVVDPSIWDSKFIFTFSLRLAAQACPQLLGLDSPKQAMLNDLYIKSLSETKRVGFSEKRQQAEKKSDYVTVRG